MLKLTKVIRRRIIGIFFVMVLLKMYLEWLFQPIHFELSKSAYEKLVSLRIHESNDIEVPGIEGQYNNYMDIIAVLIQHHFHFLIYST